MSFRIHRRSREKDSGAAGRRIVGLALIVLFGCLATAARAQVGFFAPDGLPPSVIASTRIGLFNALGPEQVRQNLERTRGTQFKALVDLGPILAKPADPSRLRMRYILPSGKHASKQFKPRTPSYLRVFPSNATMLRALEPVLEILARHKENVGAVLVADEPYTHGLSKADMERAARIVRSALDKHGMGQVKIGVIFASGMFDRDFAHLMDREAGAYVQRIDRYYLTRGGGLSASDFAAWVKSIRTRRLVTYDRAGNMYVDGGLPRGYDFYGFDFYLSTLLLDRVHEHSLAWFAARYADAGCRPFAGLTMSRIRRQLSFFRRGGILHDRRYGEADRRMLDAMYTCRMNAVTAMLKHAAAGRKAGFLLLSESSDNGLLEFDPAGEVRPVQSMELTERRVLDEVHRAQSFYDAHRCLYSAGLLYFTYRNTYDATIKLHVGGASAMPSVMASIDRFAAKEAAGGGAAATRPAAACPDALERSHESRGSRLGETPLASFTIQPHAISSCGPGMRIKSKVVWSVHSPSIRHVKVAVLDPGATHGKIFSSGGYAGSAETGEWVVPGTRFDLINADTGASLATRTVTARVCASNRAD